MSDKAVVPKTVILMWLKLVFQNEQEDSRNPRNYDLAPGTWQHVENDPRWFVKWMTLVMVWTAFHKTTRFLIMSNLRSALFPKSATTDSDAHGGLFGRCSGLLQRSRRGRSNPDFCLPHSKSSAASWCECRQGCKERKFPQALRARSWQNARQIRRLGAWI